MSKKGPVPKGWERKRSCKGTIVSIGDTSTQIISAPNAGRCYMSIRPKALIEACCRYPRTRCRLPVCCCSRESSGKPEPLAISAK
jgi:hypothetical protein